MLAQEAQEELRSLVFELRPPALESEGLAEALRKHVDVLQRVYRREIALEGPARRAASRSWSARSSGSRRRRFRTRSATRTRRSYGCDLAATDGRVELTVSDDGVGFDPTAPAVRSRRLGLTSMEERAQALGGTLTIESEPGRGTTVRPVAP